MSKIEYVLEKRGVIFAFRAYLDLPYRLVALIGIGQNLVTDVGFAVFLLSTRMHIPLVHFGRFLASWHRAFVDNGFLSLTQRLPRHLYVLASVIWLTRAM